MGPGFEHVAEVVGLPTGEASAKTEKTVLRFGDLQARIYVARDATLVWELPPTEIFRHPPRLISGDANNRGVLGPKQDTRVSVVRASGLLARHANPPAARKGRLCGDGEPVPPPDESLHGEQVGPIRDPARSGEAGAGLIESLTAKLLVEAFGGLAAIHEYAARRGK
jgi:hypothetical protein